MMCAKRCSGKFPRFAWTSFCTFCTIPQCFAGKTYTHLKDLKQASIQVDGVCNSMQDHDTQSTTCWSFSLSPLSADGLSFLICLAPASASSNRSYTKSRLKKSTEVRPGQKDKRQNDDAWLSVQSPNDKLTCPHQVFSVWLDPWEHILWPMCLSSLQWLPHYPRKCLETSETPSSLTRSQKCM